MGFAIYSKTAVTDSTIQRCVAFTGAAVRSNMAPVCARVALPSGHVMFTNTLSRRLLTIFALRTEQVARARCLIHALGGFRRHLKAIPHIATCYRSVVCPSVHPYVCR